jgi:S1-C subfamily serine protease
MEGYDFTVYDVEKLERANVTKETEPQISTGANPDHPTRSTRDPEAPAIPSTGMTEESRIGVWFTGNPTAKHDGLEISGVQPNGPAANIDIKRGDVIIAIDGHYLYTIEELRAELLRHEQGGRLAIRYRHDRLTYENYLALTTEDATPRK